MYTNKSEATAPTSTNASQPSAPKPSADKPTAVAQPQTATQPSPQPTVQSAVSQPAVSQPAARMPVRHEPIPPTIRPENNASIGSTIEVEGTVKGQEDLLIEGKVKGTVEIKDHCVTIGTQGNVSADVFARIIYIDGTVTGNLVASEKIIVRKSADIQGSIVSPRISLEDGAQLNGSIDMNPQSEVLHKAFGKANQSSGSSTINTSSTLKTES
ncbi:hypothetical protein DN062_07535 [Nitrincola tibetensis]|uniref:Polymer-forming cytoskeletal protein n=1 Tax=Nitrincola tibetensis TaxID=2219697 RepID=A0A364NNL8_9GAMM|nr:polymer-forming cytoskeletal protein [Nitrincola tibetensis]RAU18612.1 hypothetical protein DN062_07535 [Nitrincola tibetensis]